MKELTFKEVIANIKEGEIWVLKDSNFKIFINKYNQICFKNNDGLPTHTIGIDMDKIFIKEQTSVSFEQVLNSDNNCRVEHKLIEIPDEITCEDELIISDFISLQHREYLPLHSLLSVLPWILDNNDFKKVIKEGKWYLED